MRYKPVALDDKKQEALLALNQAKPVLFYGPAGTGKTILAEEIAEELSKSTNTPVVYLQLYPELTKTPLIGGDTIKNGNIVTDTGVIIKHGSTNSKTGAIFVVDECTHATESCLLAFNSLIESPFSTVVGNKIYKMHEKTRFIFLGNPPDHSGNIELPRSFASRLFIVDFPVPTVEQMEIILRGTVKIQSNDHLYKIQEFIISIADKTRDINFAIPVRNIINCMEIMKDIPKNGYVTVNNIGRNTEVLKAIKELKANPFLIKNIILNTLMANICTKSNGPEKVKALLWE